MEIKKETIGSGAGITGTSYSFTSTKTYYYAITLADFTPNIPQSDDVGIGNVGTGIIYGTDSTANLYAPLHLPHGATITEAKLYGNSSATWILNRIYQSSLGQDTIGTANFNSADSTISDALVNNSQYSYVIWTQNYPQGGAPGGGLITGGYIKYTLSEL